MKLSEQLQVLSQRTKKFEDSVSAAHKNDRADLKRRLDQLNSDIEDTGQRIETSAADAKENLRSGWADIKRRIEERVTAARTKLQERKAERDVNKAEHRAQAAENDAADAIAFAVYVLDQAEYAVVDAALARAEADDLRAAA